MKTGQFERHAKAVQTDEIKTCKVCFKTGTDIVTRLYYDRALERDSLRYECDNIFECMDRWIGKYKKEAKE